MRSGSLLVGALVLGVPLLFGADTSFAKDRAKAAHAGATVGKAARHVRPSKRRAMRSHDQRSRKSSGFGAASHLEAPKHGRPALLSILPDAIRCPPDMVAVAGRVCVDRFETTLVDVSTGRAWPPFYAPNPDRARATAGFYEALRMRSPASGLDAQMPIPDPPMFAIEPRAISTRDVLPQGYLTADTASRACEGSGKRLCSEAEWVTACRGETETEFPYGERYEQGTCNVYRESHPSFLLHDNAARYHDDPRNNQVAFEGRNLLQKTGESTRCASVWGSDAVFDMVGNLDEWVSDETGVFVGGFYSRGTRSGCFARVSNHPRTYSDYSTGARCCADPGALP